jgi:hypothetical protein
MLCPLVIAKTLKTKPKHIEPSILVYQLNEEKICVDLISIKLPSK